MEKKTITQASETPIQPIAPTNSGELPNYTWCPTDENASVVEKRMPETDANELSPLPEGTLLADRYVLMKHIAGGGTSDVYRARDLVAIKRGASEQSYVAVKLIKPSMVKHLGSANAVLDEALITRHLSHPNIIKVFDYHTEPFPEGDHHFVTMEWIEGETLADRLKRMPDHILPYEQAISIFEKVADALEAAHAAGIVHADLKPSNILIGVDGRVKVIDFATARGISTTQRIPSGSTHDVATLDAQREFFGYTEGYASEAIKNDGKVSIADDVYGFAAMLHEALSGLTPKNRQIDNWPKPRSIHYAQWPLLRRALLPRATQRWPEIGNFFHAFKQARHRTRRISITLLTMAIFSIAVWQTVQAISHFRNDLETLTQTDQNVMSATDMAEVISNTPINSLSSTLDKTQSLPELLRAGVLGVTEPIIISKLSRFLDTVLTEHSHTTDPHELFPKLVDFTALDLLITEVKPFFPQSYPLHMLQERINSAKNAEKDLLLERWHTLWAAGEYTEEASDALAALQTRLKDLDHDIDLTLDATVQTTYRRTIRSAALRRDTNALAQLVAFEQRLSDSGFNPPWFQHAWRGFESSHDMGQISLTKTQSEKTIADKSLPDTTSTPNHSEPLKNTSSTLSTATRPLKTKTTPKAPEQEQNRPKSTRKAPTLQNTATPTASAPKVTLPLSRQKTASPEKQRHLTPEMEKIIHEELNRIDTIWLDRDLLIAETHIESRLSSAGLTLKNAAVQPIIDKLYNRITQKIAQYRKNDPHLLTTSLEKALVSLERYRQ